MIWFLLLLSFMCPLMSMDRNKNKKKLFTYSLPNPLRRSNPDKPDLPALSFHATPMEFQEIASKSDSFAHHVQDESIDLAPEVQHLFNTVQYVEHHKKSTLSDDDIAKVLQSHIEGCEIKLNLELSKLKDIESNATVDNILELDLVAKKIKILSRELMTLSHAHHLHNIYVTKKRIDDITRRQMNSRLQPLFAELEAAKKQLESKEKKITP